MRGSCVHRLCVLLQAGMLALRLLYPLACEVESFEQHGHLLRVQIHVASVFARDTRGGGCGSGTATSGTSARSFRLPA